MVLQEVGPRVTLTFLPHLDPQREKSPLLDKSIPDDCHIEEALAFQVTHRSTRTAILTHDTGPMLTAGRVGLEPLGDSRCLAPGAGKRRIAEADRGAYASEQIAPRVSMRSCRLLLATSTVRHLRLSSCRSWNMIRLHPAWSQACWPICATPFLGRTILQSRHHRHRQALGHSFRSAATLVNTSHPCRRRLSDITGLTTPRLTEAEAYPNAAPERLMMRTCFAGAGVRLENIGTKTGRSVQVDFTATPGFLLRPRARDGKAQNTKNHDLMLPHCPDPPQGKYVDNLGSWAERLAHLQGMRPLEALGPPMNIASLLRPEPRDPTAFYYRDGGRTISFRV